MENQWATHMIEFRYGDEWNGLIYFIFIVILVINLGQKRRKETSLHSRESPWTLKNSNVGTILFLVPPSQGFQLFIQEDSGRSCTEEGLCMCVKQICTLLHDSALKTQANISFFLPRARGLPILETQGLPCFCRVSGPVYIFCLLQNPADLLLKLHGIRFTSGLTTALFIWKRESKYHFWLPTSHQCHVIKYHGRSCVWSLGCWIQLVLLCPSANL